MRDAAISEFRVRSLHPKVSKEVEERINWIELNKFTDSRVAIRIVQAVRTIEYQNDLYALGRTKPGRIVTNARGGSSYHNYGLAFDFALLYDKDGNGTFEELSWDQVADFDRDGQRDWQEVVNSFKDLNWRWGGDFKSIKDNPHMEKTFNHDVRTLYNMYKLKKFIPGTTFLNI